MKKVEDYTEKTIKEATYYISENNITDEDLKQDLYVLALECAKEKNEGKFKYSFVRYLERKESIKYLNRNETQEEYILISNISYNMEYIDLTENLLYVISLLDRVEQEVLFNRFVNLLTFKEIGYIMNISASKVQSIEHKILKKMRCQPISSFIKNYYYDNKSNNSKFCYYFEEMINGRYKPQCGYNIKPKEYKYHQNIEKITILNSSEIEMLKRDQEEKLLRIKRAELLEPVKHKIKICNVYDRYNEHLYVKKVNYLLENYSEYLDFEYACRYVFKINFWIPDNLDIDDAYIKHLPIMYYDYCTGVNLYEKYGNIHHKLLYKLINSLNKVCLKDIPLLYKETSTCFKITISWCSWCITAEPIQITDSKIEYNMHFNDDIIKYIPKSQFDSILNYITNQM